MKSKRKVIAQVSEYVRKPERTKNGALYLKRTTTMHIFDSYGNFEIYKHTIAIEDHDPKKPTVRCIDWWWYCD